MLKYIAKYDSHQSVQGLRAPGYVG